jgi:hypothetical protein
MSVTRFGDGVPLNEKGQIVTHNGTTATSLSVGSDGQILTAQSSASSGLIWANISTGETQYVTLISNTAITSAVHSITLSSIPGTYDELILVMSLKRGDAATTVESSIRINATSAGYGIIRYTTGTGAASNAGDSETYYWLGGPEKSIAEISFPLYAGDKSKTVFIKGVTSSTTQVESYPFVNHTVWDNSSAITSVTIYAGAVGDVTRTFATGNDYYILLYGVDWS